MEKQIRRGCQLGPPARLFMLTLWANGSVGTEYDEITAVVDGLAG